MSTTTTTGTLAAGESKTFTLAPGAAVSLTLSPNIRVTITETPESVSGSGVGGNTTRVHEPQLPGTFAYGPYAMGGVVVVAVASNSGSSVAWTRKDTVVTMNEDSTSLVSGDGTQILLSSFGRNRAIGASLDQPAEITKPVSTYGKLACRFGTGQWSATTGSPTLTQGYTGWDGSGAKTGITSRTGQPDMLKVVPAANTNEVIRLGTFATNMLTKALGGKFGLWVYVEAQPGYQVGGTLAGTLSVGISTNAATMGNSLSVGYTTNQVREGWNFLSFVMRNPLAYQSGSGATEYHPFGVACSGFGTGVDSNILATDAARIEISWLNMFGATMYFDSMWTAFTATPQIVWGNDAGTNLLELAKPIFDSYGWAGYAAHPYSSGGTHGVITDLSSNIAANGLALYASGWDFTNHTANHPPLGGLSVEAQIVYEMETARAWQLALGLTRGVEFYSSPQSSSSRLSEGVISGMGFKLQRHARKWNVHVTPFGIDNPGHLGAIDMGNASSGGVSSITAGTGGSVSGFQTATKIKRAIDVVVAYQCAFFPFWHGVTQSGDTGSGEDATGDNLLLTYSAFQQVCAYVRQLEAAGSLQVCRGMTGFYYGG